MFDRGWGMGTWWGMRTRFKSEMEKRMETIWIDLDRFGLGFV